MTRDPDFELSISVGTKSIERNDADPLKCLYLIIRIPKIGYDEKNFMKCDVLMLSNNSKNSSCILINIPYRCTHSRKMIKQLGFENSHTIELDFICSKSTSFYKCFRCTLSINYVRLYLFHLR